MDDPRLILGATPWSRKRRHMQANVAINRRIKEWIDFYHAFPPEHPLNELEDQERSVYARPELANASILPSGLHYDVPCLALNNHYDESWVYPFMLV